MRILFTLCGRSGSKGCKNKNIKDLLGIPLVYYSLAAINLTIKKLSSKYQFDIVVNTDSKELVEILEKQKECPFDTLWRDERLGRDDVSKIDVIKDCYLRAKKIHNCEYDIVLDLDITSPLRTVNDVINIINKKLEREDADAVYSVTGSRRNPYFNMVKEVNGYFEKAVKSEYVSRQQAPVFYDMNASIYAYSTEALLNKASAGFFNDKASAVIMKDTAVLDIDSEEDFELMSVIGEYLFKKYPEYKEIIDEANLINKSCN